MNNFTTVEKMCWSLYFIFTYLERPGDSWFGTLNSFVDRGDDLFHLETNEFEKSDNSLLIHSTNPY